MNRISTTVSTIIVSVLLCGSASAADATLEELNSRMSAMESRLMAIEEAITGTPAPAHTYSEQATLEATKNGQTEKPEQTAPVQAPTASSTYVIQEGDSLGSIARDHNVERSALLTANRLSEGQPIYIGETLLIPGTEPAPVAQEENSKISAPPAPVKKEEVVIGETKPEVKKETNTASSSDLHVVVKGDTLTALSRKYGPSVADIKAANGLKSDVLNIGQKIVIPSKKTSGVASNTTNESGSKKSDQKMEYQYDNPLLKASETYGYYTVRKGDNLYALARDFFSSMGELQRLNRLGSSTLIYPGDELIVPTSKYNTYHNNGDVAKN